MKKVFMLLVLIGALFITGCTDEGVLDIINNSAGTIWFTINSGSERTLDAYNRDSFSWDLSTSIFGDEDKDITIDYYGIYTFSNSAEATVKPGKTTKIRINSDGGAIKIWNNSSLFYIEEVYISPSSSSSWGDNLIYGDLGPGEYQIWTVSPGSWDVYLVDDWGDQFVSYDNYISTNEMTVFEYTGFKKTSDAVGEKKANAAKYSEVIEGKLERR